MVHCEEWHAGICFCVYGCGRRRQKLLPLWPFLKHSGTTWCTVYRHCYLQIGCCGNPKKRGTSLCFRGGLEALAGEPWAQQVRSCDPWAQWIHPVSPGPGSALSALVPAGLSREPWSRVCPRMGAAGDRVAQGVHRVVWNSCWFPMEVSAGSPVCQTMDSGTGSSAGGLDGGVRAPGPWLGRRRLPGPQEAEPAATSGALPAPATGDTLCEGTGGW